MKTRKKTALKAFKKAKNQRELDRLVRVYSDIVLLEDGVIQKLYKIRVKLIEDE